MSSIFDEAGFARGRERYGTVQNAFRTIKTVNYRGYQAAIIESNGYYSWDIGDGDPARFSWRSAAEAESDFKRTIDKDEDGK